MSASGWLDRQIKQSANEVKSWPKWMQSGLAARRDEEKNKTSEGRISSSTTSKKSKE